MRLARFLHPHGDLEQAKPQRRELRPGEIASGRDGLAHGQHQPVGGRVQHEPNLVGHGAPARGPVGGKLRLVELDPVLRLAAGAVQALVDDARAGADQVGDDKADVEPQAGRLDAGNRATLARPALGPVRRLGKAAHDLTIFHRPLGAHRIGGILHLGCQRPRAGQTEDDS